MKHIITKQEAKFRAAAEQAARAEILHTEQAGYVSNPKYSIIAHTSFIDGGKRLLSDRSNFNHFFRDSCNILTCLIPLFYCVTV